MQHNAESESKIKNAEDKVNNFEMLSSVYATGTEQQKNRIPRPPEVKKL